MSDEDQFGLFLNIDTAIAYQSRQVTEGIAVALGGADETYFENFTGPEHAKELAGKVKRMQKQNE